MYSGGQLPHPQALPTKCFQSLKCNDEVTWGKFQTLPKLYRLCICLQFVKKKTAYKSKMVENLVAYYLFVFDTVFWLYYWYKEGEKLWKTDKDLLPIWLNISGNVPNTSVPLILLWKDTAKRKRHSFLICTFFLLPKNIHDSQKYWWFWTSK